MLASLGTTCCVLVGWKGTQFLRDLCYRCADGSLGSGITTTPAVAVFVLETKCYAVDLAWQDREQRFLALLHESIRKLVILYSIGGTRRVLP